MYWAGPCSPCLLAVSELADRRRSLCLCLARSNQQVYEQEVAAPVVDATARTVICGCIQCPQDVADTLHDMMGLTLLKDPVFLTFAVSNFLTSIGFNVPYIYIAVRASPAAAPRESLLAPHH